MAVIVNENAGGAKPSRFSKLFWTPPWTRWNPERDFEMNWSLTCLFGFVRLLCPFNVGIVMLMNDYQVAAFSVANLYYTHPILHVIAVDFDISEERASLVPTLLQTGYATGLLFIVPVGDLVPRRPMIISLVFVTSLIVSRNSFAVKE